MFLYLNPFTWGLRASPSYQPSPKTEALIINLNNKYKIEIGISEAADTVWYFRDLRNKKESKRKILNYSYKNKLKIILGKKLLEDTWTNSF